MVAGSGGGTLEFLYPKASTGEGLLQSKVELGLRTSTGGRGQRGPQSSSWHPPLEEPELPAPKVSLGCGAQGTDSSQRHPELAFSSVLVSPQACPSLSKVHALQAGEGRGQHRERLQPPLPGHPSARGTPSRPVGAWLLGHLLSAVQGLEGVWGGAR